MKAKYIIIVSLSILYFNACKPKEGVNPDGSIKMEQLVDLIPEYNINFNHEGEPIIILKISNTEQNAYEWNPADKSWHKLGGILPSIAQVVEDADDNYFATAASGAILTLNKATNQWDTLDIAENKQPANGSTKLLANAKGDVLFRKGSATSSKYFFYLKNAGSTSWTKIQEVPIASQHPKAPYFFADNGYVYFSATLNLYPGDNLIEMALNTHTKTFETLYDKTEPDNFPVLKQLSLTGQISECSILPDGSLYAAITDREEEMTTIYKLPSNGFPAKFSEVQKFKMKELNHSTGAGYWLTRLSIPFFNNSGNLKTFIHCSNNNISESHAAQVTSKIGGSQDLTMNGHPVKTPHIIINNHKGEVFVLERNGHLFRWK